MDNPILAPISETVVYGPGAALNSFANTMTSPILGKPLSIKGQFKKGKGVNYGGYFYDILKDEFGDSSMTLLVPESIRHTLEEGVVLEGFAYISKRISQQTGRLDLLLNLTEVLGRRESEVSSEELLALDVVREKSNQGYKDVDQLIRKRLYGGERVNVIVLIGTTAIIDQDITHQLSEAVTAFNIAFKRVNFTRPQEILTMLLENDGTDLLVISRGGGENLQIFNNVTLAQGLLRLNSPLMTAIGHAIDVTLIQKIADKSFITPTALGQYLRDLYENVNQDLLQSKTKLIKEVTAQLEAQYKNDISHLHQRIADMQASAHSTASSIAELNRQTIEKLNNQLAKSKTTSTILWVSLAIAILVITIIAIRMLKY